MQPNKSLSVGYCQGYKPELNQNKLIQRTFGPLLSVRDMVDFQMESASSKIPALAGSHGHRPARHQLWR